MAYTKTISTYKIYQYLGMSSVNSIAAIINLRLIDGVQATIRFIPEGNALMENSKIGGNYHVYARPSQFLNMVDTLRNEKPVYFFFQEINNLSYISTTNEEIGEEET